MCNHVYKKGGKKVCRPLTSRADYMKVCNSTANLDNWNKYRETGEDKYKRSLVEIAYNCQVPEGEPLKGNTTVSPFFFYDIDCADKEECIRIMKELVERRTSCSWWRCLSRPAMGFTPWDEGFRGRRYWKTKCA